MLRTTVASLLALGYAATGAGSAQAQTVLYGEPEPVPQPYYVDPRPVPQPFPAPSANQPLYYEPNPVPQQPVFANPPQPGVFFQPEPAQPRSFQPIPQEGMTPTRPIEPQPYRAPAETYRAPPAAPSAPPEPPVIARPEPREPAPRRADTPSSTVREAVRAEIDEPTAATEAETLRAFSEELARIVELGERYRAASPGFLEDLKALSERYRDLPVRAAAPGPDRIAAAPPLPPAPEAPEIDEPVDTAPPAPEPPQQVAALPDPPEASPSASPSPDPEPATAPDPEPVQPVELPQPLPPTSAAVVYLRDDFSDGDFAFNPSWNVRQGRWIVDPAFGLRPAAPEAAEPAQVTPQALLQYLIGDEKPETPEPSGDTGAALIEAQTDIGNAFSLVATITDHGGEGAAHFIIHQGGANWLGYRLELRAGPRPLVVLARRGSSGYKDIMKVEAPGFTSNKPHQLRWARLSDGQMFVLIDGRPIITARDTVFRQPWTGFAYFTADADVSMRNIRIAEPVER